MKKLTRHHIRLVAALAALTAGAGAAAAQPSNGSGNMEKTPIGALQDRTLLSIGGWVTHAFGNRFLLQDGSGHEFVDTGPRWFARRTFTVGELLTVYGRMDDMEFEARKIVRPDGSKEVIRGDRGPPPWAAAPGRGNAGKRN